MGTLSWLPPNSLEFPPLERALRDPEGLLAAGGDLSSDRLIAAYRRGIFPWYDAGQPILWWSPDPRCVLFPEQLHVSRSLHKRLRKPDYQVTLDRCFEQVIRACAAPRAQTPDTWISDAMASAYTRLHRRGLAHSVEVWQSGQLVGGLYGVALGQVFFGESMFSRARDASKIALVYLVEQLRNWDYHLIDCQVFSSHLARLGACEIPRSEFAGRLEQHIDQPGTAVWEMTWDYRTAPRHQQQGTP